MIRCAYYAYLSNDGRHGEGDTTWQAMVAALGVEAGLLAPDLYDLSWSYSASFGWRVALAESRIDDEPVGMFFELPVGWFAPRRCECKPPAWCPACDDFTEETLP